MHTHLAIWLYGREDKSFVNHQSLAENHYLEPFKSEKMSYDMM